MLVSLLSRALFDILSKSSIEKKLRNAKKDERSLIIHGLGGETSKEQKWINKNELFNKFDFSEDSLKKV
jgi:hypothetical protein